MLFILKKNTLLIKYRALNLDKKDIARAVYAYTENIKMVINVEKNSAYLAVSSIKMS